MTATTAIFDRDGVLTYFDAQAAAVAVEPLIPITVFELAQRWQRWGEQVGFPDHVDKERQFFRSFWDNVCAEFDLSQESRTRLHAVDYLDFIVAYPEARDILSQLQRRGISVGVLSNFSMASLDASLERVGLSEYVDVACAATVIGASKPDRAAYVAVTRLLEAPPERCLFFDDEKICVDGGTAYGMNAFLIDRRRRKNEISANVLHDLTAIPSLFSQLSR